MIGDPVPFRPSGWGADCQTLLTRLIARYRLPPSDADDVLQQVLVEVLMLFPDPLLEEDESRLNAWLSQVLRSKVVNLFRDRARRRASPLADILGTARELSSWANDPASPTDDETDIERIWQKIMDLAEDQLNFSVFVRRYVDGLTTAEIAAATGLTPKQALDRQAWFLAKLQKALGVDPRPRRKPKG